MIPANGISGPKTDPFETWLSIGRERMRKGERTRLDLLISGTTFLADNTLDLLTVSTVCQQAGVAHGTFYLYFKDRNDLAGHLLSKFVDYLQVQMRGAARQDGDPIRNTTAGYFELFKANAGLMKCLVVGIDAFPEARAAFQRLNNEWARTVVRAYLKKHRGSRPAEDELMRRAYALGGMVDQYLTALFVTKDPWVGSISKDPDTVVDTLTTLWTKGMGE